MDRQRSKVYRWERQVVAPHDLTLVPFNQIEMIVKHVWEQEGLKYPPLVQQFPRKRKRKRTTADSSRTKLRFHSHTHTWVILHEIAHSMTSLHDGKSNWHGALFLGVYCQLLSRYMNFNFLDLINTAQDAGLRVNPEARPIFLEGSNV